MYTVNELFARAGDRPFLKPEDGLVTDLASFQVCQSTFRITSCGAVCAAWGVCWRPYGPFMRWPLTECSKFLSRSCPQPVHHPMLGIASRILLPPMLAGELTLSVTTDLRLDYAQYLLVYGKSEMKSSSRFRGCCSEYNVSQPSVAFTYHVRSAYIAVRQEAVTQGQVPEHHVFEPSLISIALQKPTGPNLSHLIFKTDEPNLLSNNPDPLTQYAGSRGELSIVDLGWLRLFSQDRIKACFTPAGSTSTPQPTHHDSLTCLPTRRARCPLA